MKEMTDDQMRIIMLIYLAQQIADQNYVCVHIYDLKKEISGYMGGPLYAAAKLKMEEAYEMIRQTDAENLLRLAEAVDYSVDWRNEHLLLINDRLKNLIFANFELPVNALLVLIRRQDERVYVS